MILRRSQPHRSALCAWIGVGFGAAVWRQFRRFRARRRRAKCLPAQFKPAVAQPPGAVPLRQASIRHAHSAGACRGTAAVADADALKAAAIRSSTQSRAQRARVGGKPGEAPARDRRTRRRSARAQSAAHRYRRARARRRGQYRGDPERGLKPLDEQEVFIRKSLDERRTAIVEILAALQRVGHQPPPALLVQPEDALQAVRTAITLGAVLPDMRGAGRCAGRRSRRSLDGAQDDRTPKTNISRAISICSGASNCA